MRNAVKTFLVLIIGVCLFAWSFAAQKEQSFSSSNDINPNLIPRKSAVKSSGVSISPQAQIDRVIVKLVPGSRGRLSGDEIYSLGGKDLKNLNGIIRGHSRGEIRRLTAKPSEQIEREKFLLENSSGQQLADMNNYFSIAVSSTAEAENLVNRLNGLPEVEIAYAEPRPFLATDIEPPTPSYDTAQHYLRAAPEGINADYARAVTGGDGSGVKIIDIEGNWQFDHEDLDAAVDGLIAGVLVSGQDWVDHGSAVIGVMIGSDNGYGITGIVPGIDMDMVSVGGLGTTEAILTAIDSMDAGDVLLVELQAPGPRYDFDVRPDQRGYICMEYWQANFDALQMAWAKGIIVVEAAGNGYENLDDLIFEDRFDTTYRNSHAIMVGAGAPPSGNFGEDRSRMEFSNYGERLNLQGYGQEVVTTGYGSLFDGGGDTRQYYTGSFSGTSAAAPIVAGAVGAIQGIYKARYGGALLGSDLARDILMSTGSPQQPSSSQNIGPRPNLSAADSALPPPPDITIDPIYLDTVVEIGTQISVWFELTNNATDKTIEYSASTFDSTGKSFIGNWLDIPSPTGTIAPLGNVLIEVILDAGVIEDRGDKYKGLIEISSGEQGFPLDQTSIIPVFVTVPCDDPTYSVTSSDDPGGPSFEWIDITTSGVILPEQIWYNDFVTTEIMDDGTAGPQYIGFDFPFYDSTYGYIYIGANGAFSLTDSNVNVDGYFGSVSIPNPPFETFIAPFWNDINLDTASGGHGVVYYDRMGPDTFVIAFHDVSMYIYPDDSTITFEAILTRNGNIKFQYLSVGINGMEDSAVVGIAEYDCRSQAYVIEGDPVEHIVGDGTAILFDYAQVFWEMSGDANRDGDANVGDAVFLISWIFKGGQEPWNMREADCNCDGEPNVGDAVYLINYIFRSGPAPCMYEL